MSDLLALLGARIPANLAPFMLANVAAPAVRGLRHGPDFLARRLGCPCGSWELRLRTARRQERRGLFGRKTVAAPVAPVHAACPVCGREVLLFDPAQHGWSGRHGDGVRPRADDEAWFGPVAGEVVVIYAYQAEDDYRAMLADGCPDPQDWFDCFAIVFRPPGAQPVLVLADECARGKAAGV
ncbi:hypothetical protein [Massilia sp. Root335]|uniref:hypothetical protein n=1 Tax=Massilia sp. Root335 TaxID=1736517 RepID=UPI00070177D5|nr:hypothetical protein [Massilia sp. Root335]KQV40236.1 hypothetical protein ASC93_19630 [Massilia sp. Root335]